jgi:dihydroorotate dehydrogenase
MIFFALAGKQTFYNRYGFINKKFDRYIEKLKKRTMRDIEVDNSLVLSPGKTLPSSLLKRLIRANILDKPIPEVAQFVLDTCKYSSKTNVSIVNDIIKYFKLKVIIDNQYEHVLSRSRSGSKGRVSRTTKTSKLFHIGTSFG